VRQRCHAGQGRADRGDEAGVGIGGDQSDSVQAAGDQVAEEREPAGTVLAGGDLDSQHLAVAVGINTGRDKGMDRHDPAAFADLQHQGVSGHERERARVVEAAGAELFDVGVEVLGHFRDLALR
jgi:hypothetical protein